MKAIEDLNLKELAQEAREQYKQDVQKAITGVMRHFYHKKTVIEKEIDRLKKQLSQKEAELVKANDAIGKLEQGDWSMIDEGKIKLEEYDLKKSN